MRRIAGASVYRRFFEGRERHARELGGFTTSAFCAVARPEAHALRPHGYRPLDPVWKRFGYVEHPELTATFSLERRRLRFGNGKVDGLLAEGTRFVSDEPDRSFRLATAQYDIGFFDGWAAYERKIEHWFGDAVANGARFLVFPEYFSMELASLFGQRIYSSLSLQLEAMQTILPDFLALFARLAVENRVYVVAGTFPVAVADGSFRNRSFFFRPDGTREAQDKLQMTRFENERWIVAAGDRVEAFTTEFGVLGINVCYDSEFPLIARAQVELGATLIVVPSCTDTLAGYFRVQIGARARALENQCYVVHASTVGSAPWSEAVDVNIGAAAVYGPIDLGFPDDGIIAQGELNVPAGCSRTSTWRTSPAFARSGKCSISATGRGTYVFLREFVKDERRRVRDEGDEARGGRRNGAIGRGDEVPVARERCERRHNCLQRACREFAVDRVTRCERNAEAGADARLDGSIRADRQTRRIDAHQRKEVFRCSSGSRTRLTHEPQRLREGLRVEGSLGWGDDDQLVCPGCNRAKRSAVRRPSGQNDVDFPMAQAIPHA